MIPLRVDKGCYHMGCFDLQDIPTFRESGFETSFNCRNVIHKQNCVKSLCLLNKTIVFKQDLQLVARCVLFCLQTSEKTASKSSVLLINPSVFNTTLSVFVSPFSTHLSDSASCNLLPRHGRETATQRVCDLLPSSKERKWRDVALLLQQLSDL